MVKADRKILMRVSAGDVGEAARAPVESHSSEGREGVGIFKDSANTLRFASSAANASNVVARFSGISTLFFQTAGSDGICSAFVRRYR